MKVTDTARSYNPKYRWTLQDAKAMVGTGWGKLIEKIWVKLPKRVLIEDIKEKYGTLRFYVSPESDRTFNMIHEVEKESGTVCEMCGDPGKTRFDLGWYKTLCDKHYNERLGTYINK